MRKIIALIFITCISIEFFGQQDQAISDGVIFDGEPYLVVDPLNSQHFVVAWMSFQFQEEIVIRSKTSWNGGQTWSTATYIPHLMDGHTSADVSMQFDLEGNLFLAFIDFDNDAGETGAVYVSKSTDGGLTWGQPVEAISVEDCPDKLCVDRPWMVIDHSDGVNQGNIYITTVNGSIYPVSPPYHPYLVVSSDHGESFSPVTTVDGGNFVAGSILSKPIPAPAVGADGQLHIVYPSYVLSQNLSPIWVHGSSLDQGNSFSYHEVFVGGNGFTSNLLKIGPLLIANPNDANHLAFFMVRAEGIDPDIYMTESHNQGETWSVPERINDDAYDNGKTQDLVWADFDELGNLAVCWRDRRDDLGTGYEVSTKIYGAYRQANTTQFGQNFEVSSQAAEHQNILNEAGNDFMCLQLVNDTLNAVWGDVRSGTLSIYLNRIAMSDGSSSITKIVDEDLQQFLIYPNPSQDFLQVKNIKESFDYQIFSLDGTLVDFGRAKPGQNINMFNLLAGEYLIHIKTGTKTQTMRITLQ